MAISKDVEAAFGLETLQNIVNQTEPGAGPLVGIEIVMQDEKKLTRLTFDTGEAIIKQSVSTLKLANDPAPSHQILFVQGRAVINNQEQVLKTYVPPDEGLLINEIVSFFESKGWKSYHGTAIAANIKAESSFNPANIGDNGASYGLCQWQKDRRTNFGKFLNSPIEGSAFMDQLGYVDWELTHTFALAATKLRAASTAQQAAETFCTEYEKPDDPQKKKAQARGTLAAELQKKFFA